MHSEAATTMCYSRLAASSVFVAKQRDGAFSGVSVVVRIIDCRVITVLANIERTAQGSHILSLTMSGGRIVGDHKVITDHGKEGH